MECMPTPQPPWTDHADAAPPVAATASRGLGRRVVLRAAGLGAAGVLIGAGLSTDSVARGGRNLLSRADWGAYASREPFPDCNSHFTLERMIGTRFPRMSWFSTWGVSWPGTGGEQAAAGGYDVLIAWQPTTDGRTPIRFTDLVAGRHDEYLERFYTRAANHPGKVVVRFAHEPNGTGYPWSVDFRGTTGKCVESTDEYVAGWRYVVDFYRRLLPRLPRRNISFCWCITTRDRGTATAEQYFPGNDVVDVLAMDVYNGYGGYWASPRSLLAAPYARLTALGGDQPIWITELGCREPSKTENSGVRPDKSKSKAQWMQQLFDLTDYPRIEAVYFFHAERAHDWRLNSSPEALAVCRSALAGRYR
ncbi:hypothetical protein FDO65_16090 [Nakamurella flava]|uniref:GH26 domain-containing protein n=2 Tax=Nakamurella flava TaxID=2576308 RepID=A0A4U6QCJ4_9ACTN|nr:hypothetical protein FDO65_16090 [Nakamurella flava]